MNNDPFTPEPSTPPQPFDPQPEAPQQPVNQTPVQQPGSQFNQPQQPVAQPQFAPQPQQPMAQPPVGPKKSKKGLIIGLIIGVLVLGSGATAFMLWQGNNEETPAGQASTGDKSETASTSNNTGNKKVTMSNEEVVDLVKSMVEKVSGVSGSIILIPAGTTDMIEVMAVVDEEPVFASTLNGLVAAIANGVGISDITKAKISFAKSDSTVPAAKPAVAAERMGISAAIIGTPTDNSITFDITKARDLMTK